jgi:NAD-dependent SIR2 family protein deacetylase
MVSGREARLYNRGLPQDEPRVHCGCFHCLHIYEAIEVIDWIDDGETPLCPHCGVDAVMFGVTDLGELVAMHHTRFGRRLDRRGRTASDTGDDN